MNKKILGLDLGTNSIGWALVEQNFENKYGKILGIGSRIIPMSQDIIGEFGKGNSVSQTAERTRFRSVRRLRERYLLRRERLHRVLNVLDFLPEHYASEVDFEKRLGKFLDETEPKIAWKKNNVGKFEFLFQNSFNEMVEDFKTSGQEIKIPYDWTIYYLRKKAITAKIEKEELAWLILNFNQKRGYYQLRGEDDETPSNIKEYVEVLTVVKIEKGETDKKNNNKHWYNITLNNGWIYTATFSTEPQWLNVEKEFLITEELDENGEIKIVKDRKQDKEGKEKRKITPLPTFEEIDLMSKADQDKIYKKIKAKTEVTISNSGKTVGAYIYDTLLQKPKQKIRGKLIRTIERKFYKEELRMILQKQIELQPELFNTDLYNEVIRELYRNNDAQQLQLSNKDFVHLFLDDIIFYQRPLRSQKSSIGNCTLEKRKYKDEEGTEHTQWLKAIPKSNPYYQEFRIWQWMHNLTIYKKEDDSNVTAEFLSSAEDWEDLFEFLNDRKDVDQKALIRYILDRKGFKGKGLTSEIEKYRWNYVEDKKYPCNETKTLIRTRLEKVLNITDNLLTRETEQQLWHIIYSVTDKIDYEKALKTFAVKHQLHEISFVEAFKKIPPFKSDYGTFSEKAIKKLLPLLRLGKYWSWDAIDKNSKNRIEKIVSGEYDETIKDKIRDKTLHLKQEKHFQGLQLWLAQYIVYGRHSEAAEAGKWNSVADLEQYLHEFKQHSLRNPIVEQVVTETLRVVKDIWAKYGNGAKDFFDEIHIEIGREMKLPAEERDRMTKQITENENTNLRIKALLAELINDENVENVRPYSPMQQEILKIYEDGVLNSDIEIPEDIEKIRKTAQPSSSELQRYKLWLEQKYRSPYTGKPIPLGKLFTSAYEIEHIIPQSRYFDDSLSNKVICEAAVNKLKDNQLGLEFIKKHHGQKVEIGFGETVEVFSEAAYTDFVKVHYDKNRGKRNKLLLDDIPEKMIARQMNDTRYISKYILSVLSSIVRSENNDDGINSKNIITGNGRITATLKKDWGLNDVWNDLILPRFERLNQLTNSKAFTSTNKEGHTIPAIPLELSRGFQKKRIDHRHHALDALVIACATRDHVNLLNNQSAKSDTKRYDLQRKLCRFEKVIYTDGKTGKRVEREVSKEFLKPWDTINVDAKNEMERIVVSFKQNLRVINKATNKYEKIENGKKVKVEQKGVNWAIRKPMHKDTVSGKVELPRIKVPKGKILTATRKSIDTSFDLKTIESITDTGIQKILINYLKAKNNNPELAFSAEGLEDLNKNIAQYNDGKFHQPIYKVRIFEMGSKFAIGQKGTKNTKFVEAAKGTNLFFAIYINEIGNRTHETIPLNIVIERQKQGLNPVPETNSLGETLLFYLSPDDLVYVPTEDEKVNSNLIEFINLTKKQRQRIFFVNDFSGSTCYFRPNQIAAAITAKEVDLNYDEKKNKTTGSFDTKTAKFEGNQIKDSCIKLKIDRLGKISRG